jgi:hypothetical protein
VLCLSLPIVPRLHSVSLAIKIIVLLASVLLTGILSKSTLTIFQVTHRVRIRIVGFLVRSRRVRVPTADDAIDRWPKLYG